MHNACVVGLGSPYGDDRFGWVAVDRIALEIESRGLAATVRRAGSPAQILDWLDGLQCLIVVDACQGLDSSHQVLCLEWPAQALRHMRGSGSHDCTLWQTLALADRLNILPPCCRLWCAQGLQFDVDAPLSPSLLALIPELIDDVVHALTE